MRLAPCLQIAVLLLASACGPPRLPAARGLLLVSIDTLRADALGSYGSMRGASPFLDALAARSVRFAHAWSHSPKTAPSHMTMLTGLPPRVHGVGNLGTAGAARLGDAVPTLAEILRGAGFATAGITSGGNVKGALGFDRGFELFVDRGSMWAAKAARARKWLAELGPEARWFLFLHTYHVHDPYLPPPELAARYVDAAYSGAIEGDPNRVLALVQAEEGSTQSLDKRVAHAFWQRVDESSAADRRHLHDLYLACLADLDAKLCELFAWIEARGLFDDALVVVTSDHGEAFGEHAMMRHEQLWQEVLRVPLLVRLPGDFAAGVVLDADVGHVDLVPSLLELLDLPDPLAERTGASWAGWLADPSRAKSRAIYSEHRARTDHALDLWSLRSEGWLLHQDRGGASLHELARDPLEREPVEDSARAARLLDLQRRELGRQQALSTRFGSGAGVELDPETRAELEALGYL